MPGDQYAWDSIGYACGMDIKVVNFLKCPSNQGVESKIGISKLIEYELGYWLNWWIWTPFLNQTDFPEELR